MTSIDLRRFGEGLRPAGLAVARFGVGEVETVAYGAVTPQARFEIGSITKVFNTRLLVELEAAGVVSRNEPVAALLGPDWRIGPHVTLERLARHRSGLPRTPRRLWRWVLRKDPWGELTVDALRASLPTIPRPRWFRYSNFGAALLGHALAARGGAPWPQLIDRHVTGPLGLARTSVDGPVEQPHGRRGRPAPVWTLTAVQAAGALRSTTADLARFAAAEREWLGWMEAGDVRWHNGGTGGSSSFVGFDVVRGTGVALLANRACSQRLTALGLRALRR